MNNVHFRPDPLKDSRRALAVKALAAVCDRDVGQTAEQLYGEAEAVGIAKAAVGPISTGDVGGFAGVTIAQPLRTLLGRSAAAQLFALGFNADMTGLGSITLPRASTEFPNALWVAERGPAPVLRGILAATILVPRKLMPLSALTNELADYSAESAEQNISDLLEDMPPPSLQSHVARNHRLADARRCEGRQPLGRLLWR